MPWQTRKRFDSHVYTETFFLITCQNCDEDKDCSFHTKGDI